MLLRLLHVLARLSLRQFQALSAEGATPLQMEKVLYSVQGTGGVQIVYVTVYKLSTSVLLGFPHVPGCSSAPLLLARGAACAGTMVKSL